METTEEYFHKGITVDLAGLGREVSVGDIRGRVWVVAGRMVDGAVRKTKGICCRVEPWKS